MKTDLQLDSVVMYAPTYYGTHDPLPAGLEEFDQPKVPMAIYNADGIRIVLGTTDSNELDKPDVQIERRPNGWAIFLHPEPGGDAAGYVYFLDDGRSFLVREYDHGLPYRNLVELEEQPPEVDQILEPKNTV